MAVEAQIRRTDRCLVAEGRTVVEAWGVLGPGFGGAQLDADMVAAFERAKRAYPAATSLMIDKVDKGLIIKTTWSQLWVDGVLKLEALYIPPSPLSGLLAGLAQLLGL